MPDRPVGGSAALWRGRRWGARTEVVLKVILGDEPVQHGRELVQLGEMGMRELGHKPVAVLGELDTRDPAIARIRPAADQARRHRAVHQLDRTVVAQQQVVRDLAHRRRHIARMPLDGHEQLVLHRGDASGARLLLAPVLETTEGDPEREEVLEIPASWLRQRKPPAARGTGR